ncbi:MAG: hypothetical protein ABW098_17680 [Candidatus Thiodiazotropha sp.]
MKSMIISIKRKMRSVLDSLSILFLYVLLSACNNNNDQFPPGTLVTIAPESFTWTVTEALDETGRCIFSSDDYQDNFIVITVKDENDRPIGEMELQIYLSPSNSTSPPQPDNLHIFHLYDDLNNNGVVDHPQELVSGSGESIIYITETEKYHGTKSMIVRTNTSCGGYLATLNAYAGDGYGTMSINTQDIQDVEESEEVIEE